MTDLMISNLIGQLPSFARVSDWKRLYQMEIDGKSYIKFYELTRGVSPTIIVIKDEFGYVFGAFVQESWKLSYMFYGNGGETLFTFRDTTVPDVYNWSGVWKGAGSGQH